MPGERGVEEIAEEMFNEADQDESTDDLTRGTEIYEDEDLEYEESEEDELDFEPQDYGSGGMGMYEPE